MKERPEVVLTVEHAKADPVQLYRHDLAPPHPGVRLRKEMGRYGLKAYTLAKRLGIPRTRIERIAAETHPVTYDTALRLERFFYVRAEQWMSEQVAFDLHQFRLGRTPDIEAITKVDKG